ncbi:hypothetical protein [Streptomyces sp. NPDC056061]|uniref:hypothetical protein n=1 Tax=Streptomyces sp. NPDC056061 TaxID=3345700 RepID=UPI0035D7E8F2
MPKTDGYGQGVQYPVLSDAPNVETAFQTAVNGLVPLTVMQFVDANARTATLIGAYAPRPGMISYLVTEDRWDRYGADKVWRPMSPGPWKPLTFAKGYTAFGGSPGYRVVNGDVYLRGAFRRTAGGDLPTQVETTFMTLPAEARPSTSRVFLGASEFTTAGGVSRFFGRVIVAASGICTYIMPAGATGDFLYLDGMSFSL